MESVLTLAEAMAFTRLGWRFAEESLLELPIGQKFHVRIHYALRRYIRAATSP